MKKINFKVLVFALTLLICGIGTNVAWAQEATAEPKKEKTPYEVFVDSLVKVEGKSAIEGQRKQLNDQLDKLHENYEAKSKELEKRMRELAQEIRDNGITIVPKATTEFSILGPRLVLDGKEGYQYTEGFFGKETDKRKDLTDAHQALNKEIIALNDKYINDKNNLISQVEMLDKAGGGDIYSYTDPKTGQVTYFEKKGDTYKSIYGVTKGCVALPAKLAEMRSCLFCPLFTTIFNTAQQMATASYGALAGPMAQIVLLGFAIWVAFKVLSQVSSFTKQDGPKFITELLIQAFKVLVTFLLLMGSSAIYSYVIGPVLRAGLEFGTAMLFDVGETKFASWCGAGIDVTNEPGVLPTYLHEKILCFIKTTQQEIAVAQSIATTLMCVGTEAAKDGHWGFLSWDYSMILQGLIIFIFSWLIMLAFAFYLIDATVRLGIVGTLLPFLIACWPFNATKKYTTTGWSMFMNTFFTYVFVGLVVMVNIKLMGQALSGGAGGFAAIEEALNSDEVQRLKDILDIGFAGFLILIACCIFGFKLSAQSGELAGNMAGASGTPIGSRIGGLGASAATVLTKGAGKTAKKALWDTGVAEKAMVGTLRGAGKAATFVGKTAKKGWKNLSSGENGAFMTPTGMLPIMPNVPPQRTDEQTPPPVPPVPPINTNEPPVNPNVPPINPNETQVPPVNPNVPPVNTPSEQPVNSNNTNTEQLKAEIMAQIASARADIAKLQSDIAQMRNSGAPAGDINNKLNQVDRAQRHVAGLEQAHRNVDMNARNNPAQQPVQQQGGGQTQTLVSGGSGTQPKSSGGPATVNQTGGESVVGQQTVVAAGGEASLQVSNAPSQSGGQGVRMDTHRYQQQAQQAKKEVSKLKKDKDVLQTRNVAVEGERNTVANEASSANIRAGQAETKAGSAENRVGTAEDVARKGQETNSGNKPGPQTKVEVKPGETVVKEVPIERGGSQSSSAGAGSEAPSQPNNARNSEASASTTSGNTERPTTGNNKPENK